MGVTTMAGKSWKNVQQSGERRKDAGLDGGDDRQPDTNLALSAAAAARSEERT